MQIQDINLSKGRSIFCVNLHVLLWNTPYAIMIVVSKKCRRHSFPPSHRYYMWALQEKQLFSPIIIEARYKALVVVSSWRWEFMFVRRTIYGTALTPVSDVETHVVETQLICVITKKKIKSPLIACKDCIQDVANGVRLIGGSIMPRHFSIMALYLQISDIVSAYLSLSLHLVQNQSLICLTKKKPWPDHLSNDFFPNKKSIPSWL